MGEESWNVYIIECRDGKLYVGITKDVAERIKLHNQGLACRFTKYQHPVRLLHTEVYSNKKFVRSREIELKGFSRIKKFEVVNKGPSVL